MQIELVINQVLWCINLTEERFIRLLCFLFHVAIRIEKALATGEIELHKGPQE